MKTKSNIIPLATAILAATAFRPFGDAVVIDESKKVAEPEILAPPPFNPEPTRTESVHLKDLILNKGTQNRVSIDDATVESYREIIREAKAATQPIPFPPLSVVRSPEGKLYAWDGFHRHAALKAEKETEYDVDIYEAPEGWDSLEYARILAMKANATHGKARTNKDKIFVVKTAMANPTIAAWSNTIMAELCGVSEGMIRTYRPAVSKTAGVRLAKKGGKTVKIDTKNIGKGKGAGKAEKAAKKAEKEKGKPESSKVTKTAQKPVVDDVLRNAIVKITGALSPDSFASQVRKGLEGDGLGLPRLEILNWAAAPKDRILEVAHLVVDLDMKPTKALAFLAKELGGNTNLDTIAMLLLTKPKKTVEAAGLKLVFADGEVTIKLTKKAADKASA